MIAGYSIKIDGIWYRAGMELPAKGEEAPSPSVVVSEPKEEPKEPVVAEISETDAIKKRYNITSKTDITMMRKEELVKIAGDLDMNGAEYLTVAVLKERIQSKLGF